MYLNTHSRFSLRYGILSVDELIDRAQAVGVTRLALTDIGTTSANWDFVRRAKEKGVEITLPVDFVTSSKFGEDGTIEEATKESGIKEVRCRPAALLEHCCWSTAAGTLLLR